MGLLHLEARRISGNEQFPEELVPSKGWRFICVT